MNAVQVDARLVGRRPDIFGGWFAAPSWRAWRVFLGALFALPLEGEDVEIFRRHTARTDPPSTPAREGWVIVGRRGGKSRIAALVAVYLAYFKDYSKVLSAGEVGTLAIVAADRRQARTILRYVNGFLDVLDPREVIARTAESITLANRVQIEVHTASWRTLRGYTLIGAVCDEIAFWRTEDSANPDHEILAGLKPGMATVPGALLLCISSSYARRGSLWDAYSRHFGQDGDVLVWQAATRAMNPTIPETIINDALTEDESAARAEWFGEFRDDLESYVSTEALRAVTIPDRTDLPPAHELGIRYLAFADPAGGSGKDSFTLCIAHAAREGKAIVDAVREIRPPFNPEQAVRELATVLRAYRISFVTGDKYAGEWPAARFHAAGFNYVPSPLTRSELYLACLPIITGGRCELPDHRRLLHQFAALERRVAKSGKDSVDHGRTGHDDVSNAAAGAVVLAHKRAGWRPTARVIFG